MVRDEILDIFMDFTRDEDHSILISSHIVSDLEKLCDTVAFLHDGAWMFFLYLSVGTLMTEVTLPLLYRFGTMKGRIVQLVLFGGIAGIVAGGSVGLQLAEVTENTVAILPLVVVALVSVAVSGGDLGGRTDSRHLDGRLTKPKMGYRPSCLYPIFYISNSIPTGQWSLPYTSV